MLMVSRIKQQTGTCTLRKGPEVWPDDQPQRRCHFPAATGGKYGDPAPIPPIPAPSCGDLLGPPCCPPPPPPAAHPLCSPSPLNDLIWGGQGVREAKHRDRVGLWDRGGGRGGEGQEGQVQGDAVGGDISRGMGGQSHVLLTADGRTRPRPMSIRVTYETKQWT